jgi:repressor LexA
MDPLTKRQAEVLFLIREFVRDNSYPPTVRDLVALAGRENTAGVQKIHDTLRKKGYIKKAPGCSRGIVPLGGGQSVWVPVVGWVAAGRPVFSGENIEGYCALDGSVVPEGVFLLIQDGDMILVSPQAKADDGAIVVAMVDGATTVKRLYRKGDEIQLVPSHPAMEPLSIRKDVQLRIIGKVVAVLRFLEPVFSSYPLPVCITNHGEMHGVTLEQIAQGVKVRSVASLRRYLLCKISINLKRNWYPK